MFTRQDYMNNVCTHREYYGQFVTDSVKSLVKNINIDAPLQEWDNIVLLNRWVGTLQETEDNTKKIYSLSNGICVLKEAKQQLVEDNK